jgi:hypothetical protein
MTNISLKLNEIGHVYTLMLPECACTSSRERRHRRQ